MTDFIDIKALIQQNRAGNRIGLPCFCTANEQVIRTLLGYAARHELPVVLEATCNQVNQEGGYTGMTPAGFIAWVRQLADTAGLAPERIIPGGDHLGPNPWRSEPAAIAMEKARTLVRQYVEAGFRKIHLDASMRCADDEVLSFAAIARRAAELCAVAERHAPAPEKLYYIMGTEVPVPGGETTEPDALDVTSVERFRNTLETHRSAFAEQGLDAAWERVVGIVTQPGVDFGHSSVFTFNPDAARSLSTAILDEPGRVFEAHSTDYQPVTALEALVEQHFFFLKVGPELTFRMREAIFALAGIESCLAPATPSHLPSVLDQAMTRNDAYWRDYYSGNPQALGLLKKYSYSDRIRYYWNEPDVQQALARLLDNLRTREMPQTCISQYFTGLAFGDIPDSPDALLERHIAKAISRYYQAAGFSGLPG